MRRADRRARPRTNAPRQSTRQRPVALAEDRRLVALAVEPAARCTNGPSAARVDLVATLADRDAVTVRVVAALDRDPLGSRRRRGRRAASVISPAPRRSARSRAAARQTPGVPRPFERPADQALGALEVGDRRGDERARRGVSVAAATARARPPRACGRASGCRSARRGSRRRRGAPRKSGTLVLDADDAELVERARAGGAAPRRGRAPRRSAWRSSGRSGSRSPSRRRRRRRCGRPDPAAAAAAGSVPARAELAERILGVEADLDRVAARLDVVELRAERLALRDAELRHDEVEAGHHLGHRMLDLKPRVHLEEVERCRRRRAGTRRCRRWRSRPPSPPRPPPRPSAGGARARPRSTAPPRRPSGAGAGASTRARRARRPCRGGRRAPGSRCGAGAR